MQTNKSYLYSLLMEVKFPSYFHLKWKHLTSIYVRGILVKFTGLLLIVLRSIFLKGISTCKDRIYIVASYGINSGILNCQKTFENSSESHKNCISDSSMVSGYTQNCKHKPSFKRKLILSGFHCVKREETDILFCILKGKE